MLTPYQFGSNSPIVCIDLDGLEGIPNPATYLFGQMGINSTTAKNIETKTVEGIEKAAKLSKDALTVAGGVVAIVGSGGAAAPIIFGAIAAGGGAAKFYLDAKGDYSSSEGVPTTASGLVLVSANYVVGDKVFSEEFIASAEFVEGVLRIDLKNLKSPDMKTAMAEGTGILTLALDAKTMPKNLKEVVAFKSSQTAQEAPSAKQDNTAVSIKKPAPKIIDSATKKLNNKLDAAKTESKETAK